MGLERFIFTVTTGRSGTGYLAGLLGLFPQTHCCHEPAPSFAECLERAQQDRLAAAQFLRSRKIPAIRRAAANRRFYIETSHLFCKGFLEPWLDLAEAPAPSLILLDRDPRQVALSLWRLETIPGRTDSAANYYLSPAGESNFTRLENWHRYNDYQLCYWYTQEIAARQPVYAQRVTERGGLVCRTSVSALQRWEELVRLQQTLKLPDMGRWGRLCYLWRRHRVVNRKTQKKRALSTTLEVIQEWEQEVRDNLVVLRDG